MKNDKPKAIKRTISKRQLEKARPLADPAMMEEAERKAQVLKALAHPLRVAVFELLAQGEMTVGELCELTGSKEANTSRHLAVMRAAGLLSTRKEGLNVFYSVKMPCLLSMLGCVDQAVCNIADEQSAVAARLGP